MENDRIEAFAARLHFTQRIKYVSCTKLNVVRAIQLSVSLGGCNGIAGNIDCQHAFARGCDVQREAATERKAIQRAAMRHSACGQIVLPLIQKCSRLLPPERRHDESNAMLSDLDVV